MSIPNDPGEVYISVDVEAAGPNPGQYSLLAIGACTLPEPRQTFYVELKPDKPSFHQEALDVSQLSMERLSAEGVDPGHAMQAFVDWLGEIVPAGHRPLFVAFNAPFDWMFVNEYFQKYLGYNPFGHAALDIKSYFMGMDGARWSETTMKFLGPRYLDIHHLKHHALQDAIDQARIFEKILVEANHQA